MSVGLGLSCLSSYLEKRHSGLGNRQDWCHAGWAGGVLKFLDRFDIMLEAKDKNVAALAFYEDVLNG